MLIGVLSDTHDRKKTIEKALSCMKESGISEVIHCGDWCSKETINLIGNIAQEQGLHITGVLGNRDTKEELLPSIQEYQNIFFVTDSFIDLQIEEVRIGIIHGEDKKQLQSIIDSQEFDVICTGHSHKPYTRTVGETLIINPGSTAFAIPRKKDFRPTIAVYNTDTKQCEIIDL